MQIAMRPAGPGDALHVAAFVDIAGHGIELETWLTSRDHDHSVFGAARRFVLEDKTSPYHYSKAYLLEVDGCVAGCMVGGLVELEAKAESVPAYVAPLLSLETRIAGFWSILAVAVYPEYRGLGLAVRLIEHACERAAAGGAAGLSIVVEDTNAGALKLYKRHGFREAESRPWLSYDGRSGPNYWIMLTRDL